ncbi:MAG TPA: hypothetical protein VE422_30810 [Terriglobia bacterium]|nr:hypothetical protein [Terriglobia bacterium]
MGRYEREQGYTDVSIIPFIPDRVHEVVITNRETGEQGRGLDRESRREAEEKAWEDLNRKAVKH